MKRIILSCLMVLILSSCLKSVSLEDALQIAQKEGARLGYDMEQYAAYYDNKNDIWSKYMGNADSYRANPDLKKKLSGRQFWAIVFIPKKGGGLDNDLTILIDKLDESIILRLEGVQLTYYD